MKKLAIIASLAAGLALQQVANAGAVFLSSIYVGHASGNSATYAYGSFDQALLSSNSREYIGCAASSDTVSSSQITCYANDANGHYASCYRNSPSDASRQVVSASGQYSWIYFAADSSGHCTDIDVENATQNK
jgi:hypothetical protein